MRIDKERVKEKRSEKAEYFGEFSKTEISSLFPASELLQKIHTDHVYTSNDYTEYQNPQEADDIDEYNHQDDILSLNADSIQKVFQRMINMTSLNTIGSQKKDIKSPEAIADTEKSAGKTPVIRKVKFVDDLPGTSDTQQASTSGSSLETSDHKTEKRDNVRAVGKKKARGNKKKGYPNKTSTPDIIKNADHEKTRSKRKLSIDTSMKNGNDTAVCKAVSENEWKAANRCAEVEREMNALLQYTAELLVRRWGEYLAMSTEQISAFEIENAKQHKMVEEAIDMLEDKDRYVWQLIEELKFF